MGGLPLDRVMAIDIALSHFPGGFSLDDVHHPHITVLQRFVDGDALDLVVAAARSVIADEDFAS